MVIDSYYILIFQLQFILTVWQYNLYAACFLFAFALRHAMHPKSYGKLILSPHVYMQLIVYEEAHAAQQINTSAYSMSLMVPVYSFASHPISCWDIWRVSTR